MTLFSLVTGYLVDKYLDSKNKVAIHQVKTDGKPETSMSCMAPGFEVNPANGENIIIQKVKGSSSFNVSIGGTNQNILPDTNRGERRLYSVSEDGSEIKSIIKLKNDGEMILNGGGDSAVLFSGLADAYNELNDKYNDLISKYNLHVHNFVGVGPGNPGVTVVTTSTGSPSTGDISPAESLDVKLS